MFQPLLNDNNHEQVEDLPQGSPDAGPEDLDDTEMTWGTAEEELASEQPEDQPQNPALFVDESLGPIDMDNIAQESDSEDNQEEHVPRRSTRVSRPPDRYGDYVVGDELDNLERTLDDTLGIRGECEDEK